MSLAKENTRSSIDATLARSPAQPVFLWRAARRLAVLAYHGVEDIQQFAAHIGEIVRVATPVSLEEVIASCRRGTGLPSRSVLITFDDGDPSVRDSALPLLRDRGVPAVAFVVAGVLGTDEPLWWNEVHDLIAAGGRAASLADTPPEAAIALLKRVRDDQRLAVIAELRRTARTQPRRSLQLTMEDLVGLESGGITIGNHSMTHPSLDRCADDRISWEVEQAHGILTSALGHPPLAFAYPNGDWDDRVREAVREAGYSVGFLFDHALNRVPPIDPLRISRVRVNSTDSVQRLRILLSGLHQAVHRLRTLGGRRRISRRASGWAQTSSEPR
jgi:peptidoglycan/xylan/chitin deacetylase (PgdA/CDA1 family)